MGNADGSVDVSTTRVSKDAGPGARPQLAAGHGGSTERQDRIMNRREG
jgi:hypothetical protein